MSILWTQKGQDIDGEAALDFSGNSVSMNSNGTIVAIGAENNDGDNGINSGHVRVYEFDEDDNSWVKKGQDIDGEAASDRSGVSVSLNSDGTIVAIGAYQNDENGSDSGHVRVYKFDEAKWVQQGQDIDGEASWDSSGFNTTLSSNGTIVAIGAYTNDGDNGTDRGHVRVYQFDENVNVNSWVKKGQDIDGEVFGDRSGWNISLSSNGTIVAIGALNNDGTGNNNTGHVRVYEFDENDNSWVKKGQDIDGEAAGDLSGNSVSMNSDGTIVAIGAYTNDGDNGINSGHVRVYEFDENVNSWVKKGSDIDGEAAGDMSGSSVSLSSDGTIVAIGGHFNDNENGSNSGHVRVYQFDGTDWVRQGQDIDGEAAEDISGFSVSLSSDGTSVAIGAKRNDTDNGSNSGHVRVYELIDTTPPDITILGSNPLNHTLGDAYIDAGATALDNVNGVFVLTSVSTVDINAVGSYTVTYTATDAAGNSSTADRVVNVVRIYNQQELSTTVNRIVSLTDENKIQHEIKQVLTLPGLDDDSARVLLHTLFNLPYNSVPYVVGWAENKMSILTDILRTVLDNHEQSEWVKMTNIGIPDFGDLSPETEIEHEDDEDIKSLQKRVLVEHGNNIVGFGINSSDNATIYVQTDLTAYPLQSKIGDIAYDFYVYKPGLQKAAEEILQQFVSCQGKIDVFQTAFESVKTSDWCQNETQVGQLTGAMQAVLSCDSSLSLARAHYAIALDAAGGNVVVAQENFTTITQTIAAVTATTGAAAEVAAVVAAVAAAAAAKVAAAAAAAAKVAAAAAVDEVVDAVTMFTVLHAITQVTIVQKEASNAADALKDATVHQLEYPNNKTIQEAVMLAGVANIAAANEVSAAQYTLANQVAQTAANADTALSDANDAKTQAMEEVVALTGQLTEAMEAVVALTGQLTAEAMEAEQELLTVQAAADEANANVESLQNQLTTAEATLKTKIEDLAELQEKIVECEKVDLLIRVIAAIDKVDNEKQTLTGVDVPDIASKVTLLKGVTGSGLHAFYPNNFFHESPEIEDAVAAVDDEKLLTVSAVRAASSVVNMARGVETELTTILSSNSLTVEETDTFGTIKTKLTAALEPLEIVFDGMAAAIENRDYEHHMISYLYARCGNLVHDEVITISPKYSNNLNVIGRAYLLWEVVFRLGYYIDIVGGYAQTSAVGDPPKPISQATLRYAVGDPFKYMWRLSYADTTLEQIFAVNKVTDDYLGLEIILEKRFKMDERFKKYWDDAYKYRYMSRIVNGSFEYYYNPSPGFFGDTTEGFGAFGDFIPLSTTSPLYDELRSLTPQELLL